jgi:hypothetical protein
MISNQETTSSNQTLNWQDQLEKVKKLIHAC